MQTYWLIGATGKNKIRPKSVCDYSEVSQPIIQADRFANLGAVSTIAEVSQSHRIRALTKRYLIFFLTLLV